MVTSDQEAQGLLADASGRSLEMESGTTRASRIAASRCLQAS